MIPVPAALGRNTRGAVDLTDRRYLRSTPEAYEAGIAPGIHATPKGLRHGFGLHAIRSGVPLNLVQRWLGHARMETTAIYLQAMGREEREMAERMWSQ